MASHSVLEAAQDLLLRNFKLGVGQDPRLAQSSKLLQLLNFIISQSARRWWSRLLIYWGRLLVYWGWLLIHRWGWSWLLLLQIINLCVLLGIRLGLLRRFRSHMMARCIGNPAHRGGSHKPTTYNSPS
jgi:hypothetical protein